MGTQMYSPLIIGPVTIANGQSEAVFDVRTTNKSMRGAKLAIPASAGAIDFLVFTSFDNGVTYWPEHYYKTDGTKTRFRIDGLDGTNAEIIQLPAEAWLALQPSTHVKLQRVATGGSTPATTGALTLTLLTAE